MSPGASEDFLFSSQRRKPVEIRVFGHDLDSVEFASTHFLP